LLTSCSYSKLTLMESLPSDRAPQKARSAQFNLFPLPSIPRADVVPRLESPRRYRHLLPAFGTSRAGPHCQRTCIEGTKKPIGWFALMQHRDRHPVSRPPSLVAAREASAPHPHPSTHFEIFFRFLPDLPANPGTTSPPQTRLPPPKTATTPQHAADPLLR